MHVTYSFRVLPVLCLLFLATPAISYGDSSSDSSTVIASMSPLKRMELLKAKEHASDLYTARFASISAVTATNGLDYADVVARIRSDTELEIAAIKESDSFTVTDAYEASDITEAEADRVAQECEELVARSTASSNAVSTVRAAVTKRKKAKK